MGAAVSDKATDGEMTSQPEPPQYVDGVLTAGNSTTQSLVDALEMGKTSIPWLAAEGSPDEIDPGILDRLGTKLDHLQSHIFVARIGILRLERHMLHCKKQIRRW